MNVTQVVTRVSQQYPWTHRVSFEDPANQYPVYQWTEDRNIPGMWVGGSFYTTGKYVTILTLKWSHL